jgi:hypothetical protein
MHPANPSNPNIDDFLALSYHPSGKESTIAVPERFCVGCTNEAYLNEEREMHPLLLCRFAQKASIFWRALKLTDHLHEARSLATRVGCWDVQNQQFIQAR